MAQADTSTQSTVAARAAYSASLFTATPAIAPAYRIEESAKLFEHTISQLLLEDAQTLLNCDVGSEVEEGSNNEPTERREH